jgi:HlyD family secretion protein
LKRLALQARVDESDIGGVKPGAPVSFTVDAYPRREFTGTVRLVQLQPQTVQNVVTYTTVIDVPNDQELLKPGMTSTVSIEVERANDTLRVPTAALRFTPTAQLLQEFAPVEPIEDGARRGAYVWQLVDGRLQRHRVRPGVSDGTQVAIASEELAPGASIITGVARSDSAAAAPAPPAASGSPLVPQMPRRRR